MGDRDLKAKKGTAAGWFLRKFFTTPASYLGIAVAEVVGRACWNADIPLGGAISLGVMVGFAVGMLSFLIMHGIKVSHRKAIATEREGNGDSKAKALIVSLRQSGQEDDARLLERMFGDRDAIVRHRDENPESGYAGHASELASAIIRESCRQMEELQDLVRREEDPLLDSPDRSQALIEEIRTELRAAYQTVADARSRLRRGEGADEIDFLAHSGSLAGMSLSSLTDQLREETAVSDGVEARLKLEHESRIVFEDTVESQESEGLRESD